MVEPAVEVPGRRVMTDWLEQRQCEAHLTESVVVRAESEPPDDPVALVRFRLAMWDRLNVEEKNAPAFRKAVLARCTGTGLTDFRALEYFTKLFIWQNNPALKGKEVGPFIPWDYQVEAARETLESLLGESENWEREDLAWEKSRELGATWWMLIIALWICLCHKNKKVLTLSHTEDAVTRSQDEDTLFGKMGFMLDRLPACLVRGAEAKRKIIKFPGTGSQISSAATTKRSGVSNRVTLVILDEFSKYRDAEEVWAQTASTGPRLCVGTHYAVGHQFFHLTQGQDRIRKVVMHWSQHPIFGRGLYRSTETGWEVLDKSYPYPRQCPECSRIVNLQAGELTRCHGKPAREFLFVVGGKPLGGPCKGLRSPWYDRECVRRKDEREVALHLDIHAQGASHQVFSAHAIHKLKQECRPPVWEGDVVDGQLKALPFGPLKLWVNPNLRGEAPFGRYGIGCDVAQGTGATPSCLSIFDATQLCRVASYANARIEARHFADLSVALAKVFRTKDGTGALLAWELNGPGVQYGLQVEELGYRNVYCRSEVAPRMYATKRSDRPGFDSGATGAIQTLIEEYRYAIQSGTLAEYSEETLEETLDYRYDALGIPEHPGKKAKRDPSGANVNHGDRVVSAALAWKMVKELGEGHRSPDEYSEDAVVGSWEWRRQQGLKEDNQETVWVG